MSALDVLARCVRRARRLRPRRLCAVLGAVAAGVLCAGVTFAQMQASEVQVKAAFVYNFALFTTWPADAIGADAPMVLCVAAEPTLQAALEKLTGKSVRGHRLEIRKISDSGVTGCHVLVSDGHAPSNMRVDPAAPILTVSATAKAAHGPTSMIALVLQDNRVVFDIDAVAARQARLQISSQLLRLARSVQ